MSVFVPGDQVICFVWRKSIIYPTYDVCDFKHIFEIIAADSGEYLLYIPDDVDLDNIIVVTKKILELNKINKKFLGVRAYKINEAQIKDLHEKLDGQSCMRCGEFYKMAEPNQSDGTFKCWLCKKYRWR